MTKNQNENEEQPQNKLAKLFGRNKRMILMLVFYFFIGGLIWFYFFVIGSSEEYRIKKAFKFPHDRTLNVRLIDTETRHGLNISFENQGDEEWKINEIGFLIGNITNYTNLNLVLGPDMFDAYYIEIPQTVTDISGLNIDI